ncbi:MAG: hypothetical protein ACHQ49_05335 [Elusimicrobiota bacterium]
MKEKPPASLTAACAGLCVLTAAFAAARSFRAEMPPSWIGRGVSELLASVAELPAGEGAKAVVIGASAAGSGFLPSAFDARLREKGIGLTSFSLTLGGSNPQVLRLVAARVRGACESRRARLRIAIVELAMESMAAGYEQRRPVLLMEALLMSWKDAAALALHSPQAGAEVLALRALGGAGNQEVPTFLLRRLFPDRSTEWLLLSRGGEADAAAPLSEAMMSEFIRAVGDIQAVSDRVYILVSPKNPRVRATAAEDARDMRARDFIARETGAAVIDLSARGAFTAADFEDPYHLNRAPGAPKFTSLLADAVR